MEPSTFFKKCVANAYNEYADFSDVELREALEDLKLSIADMNIQMVFARESKRVLSEPFRTAYKIKCAHRDALKRRIRENYFNSQNGRLVAALKAREEAARKAIAVLQDADLDCEDSIAGGVAFLQTIVSGAQHG